MGSSNNINLNKENNDEIFAVERINKKDYLLNTMSENFCIDDKKEFLLDKLNILLNLSQYKNSVKYIGYYEDDENINVVTEKCDMNLLEYLNKKGNLDINEIKEIFMQLNNIFHIMLNNNIIHKTIKLENILLKLNNSDIDKNKKNYTINDYIIKLSGYGNEIIIQGDNGNTNNLLTLAPEILRRENYDNKADLYSIGIVMYQLYFNTHPFGENFTQINDKISNEENEFKLSGNDIFDDLLKSLLEFNPEDRISWEKYFRHQFFKGNSSYNYLINNKEELLSLQYIIKGEEDDIPTKRTNKTNKEVNDNKKLISEFKSKYRYKHIKLEDKKLNFYKKNIGNEGLELLSKIKFKQIENLYLNYNKINNIKPLSKMRLVQLTKLDLSHNNIYFINDFENCNFAQLIELRLSFNQITNIDVLGNCNLSKLKLLYLGHNQINNIDVLEKCDFSMLNELYLSSNLIEDIDILANCNLSHLQKLSLSENKIENIDILAECDFSELNKLYLYGNLINNVEVFSRCNFLNINELYLYNNKIKNIKAFENCDFPQLKELSLYNNKIINLDIINKLREKYINVYY